MKWFIVFIFSCILFSCSSTAEKIENDPDDASKKNGEYIWWVNDEGVGEWIKKADDGSWVPSDGVLTDYHENSEVKLIENYLNGKLEGMRIGFDDEADTIMKFYCRGGKADSLFQYFYKNGEIYLQMIKSENTSEFNEILINYPNGIPFSKFMLSKDEYNEFKLDSIFYYHENGNRKYVGFQDSLMIYDKEEVLLLSNGAFEGLSSIANNSDMGFQLVKNNNVFVRNLPNIGCLSGDCNDGFGEFISPSSIVYEGNFENGFFEGPGKIYSLEGDLMFDVNFHLGLPSGYGKISFPDMQYEGEFYCGVMHGQGRIDYENVSYSGVFEYGLLNGKVYMYQEGFDSIVAYYKDDMEHGTTTLYYESGEIYEQKYINGIQASETQIK